MTLGQHFGKFQRLKLLANLFCKICRPFFEQNNLVWSCLINVCIWVIDKVTILLSIMTRQSPMCCSVSLLVSNLPIISALGQSSHRLLQCLPGAPARTGYSLNGWENVTFITIIGPFLGLFTVSITHILKLLLEHLFFNLDKKTFVLVKKYPKKLYVWEHLPFSTIFGSLWGHFNAWVTHIGFKRCFHVPKWLLERGSQLTLSLIWSIYN